MTAKFIKTGIFYLLTGITGIAGPAAMPYTTQAGYAQEKKEESAKDILFSRITEIEHKKDLAPEDIGELAELYYIRKKHFKPEDNTARTFIEKHQTNDPLFSIISAKTALDTNRTEKAKEALTAIANNKSIFATMRSEAYACLGDIAENKDEKENLYNTAIQLDKSNIRAHCGIITNGNKDIFSKIEEIALQIQDPLKKELARAMLFAAQARSLQIFYKNQISEYYEQDTINAISDLCKKSNSIAPSIETYLTLLHAYDKLVSFNEPEKRALKYSEEIIQTSAEALQVFKNNPAVLYIKAKTHYTRSELLFRTPSILDSRERKRQSVKESTNSIKSFQDAVRHGLSAEDKKIAEAMIKKIKENIAKRKR